METKKLREEMVQSATDDIIIIPSHLNEKEIELFIIANYIFKEKNKIPNLSEYFLQVLQNDVISDMGRLKEMQSSLYSLLHEYNYQHRLRLTVKELGKLHSQFSNNLLPCQMPTEYIDGKRLWMTDNIQNNEKNWLGHGYYWQSGDSKKDTASCQDYDCFELNFVSCSNSSKVITADYDLIKKDFKLEGKTNEEIDIWLVNECAYISEGQIIRMQQGGDIDYVEFPNSFNFTKTSKIGMRQRGFGRAASFIVNNQFSIKNGFFMADILNVKGVGTQKLATDFTSKENGLLSLVDALKEFAMEKLVHKLSKEKLWGTVQSYAVIDLGLKNKIGTINPATGYLNERYSLLIRQAHSRCVSTFDEPAFFSVVSPIVQRTTCDDIFDDLKRILLINGITSEQEPIGSILLLDVDKQIQQQDNSEWNIQADATFVKLVDFSQFYVLPSSPLPHFWKMSTKAFTRAIRLGWAWKCLKDQPNLMKLYFDVSNSNELEAICKKYDEKDNQQFEGQLGFRKPKYSWSWFLETDDSELLGYINQASTKSTTSNTTSRFFDMISAQY